MMKTTTSSLAAAALLLALATPCPAASISFREQASVLGEEMLLGELAELCADSAALADIPLGRSPEPGKAVELSRAELLGKLSIAVPAGSVEVSCPPKVVALRRHQVASRAQMLEALQAQLERRLAVDGGGQVKVTGFRVAEEPLVPEGRLSLEFELPESTERCLGSVCLPLIVKVDGQTARKLRTSATVSLERQVVCATRGIRRHEVLGRDDLRLARREVSGEPLTSLEAAVGLRASRHLEAGATLMRRDVEEPPALFKGAAVTILLESGPLTITARGTACQTARVGETVRVLNPESRRELLAVVVDGATVRIPFERW